MKTNKTSAASRISPEAIYAFRKEIYDYYKKAGRDLPWRKTFDPYHILVSEIMLQQTQVDRVIGKYHEFIGAFPDFKALNRASLTDVYKVWQGLGYNRRALSLKKIAGIILEKHDGKLPSSEEELMALPGIGKATASSIAAFGFNKPVLFVETNIRTVFIHHFFKNKTAIDDGEILPLLKQTLDKKAPGKWYSALMDYGAMLKKKYPNPSRKSAHYSRQSPFKGSRREIRGAILKILLVKYSLNKNRIVRKLAGKDEKIVHEVLREMCTEGLLRKNNGKYKIS
jgi:A/G-specific adenine glycosylase